jgi:hypothetical protein
LRKLDTNYRKATSAHEQLLLTFICSSLEPFSPNRIEEVRERESYLFLVGVVLLVKQVTLTKPI